MKILLTLSFAISLYFYLLGGYSTDVQASDIATLLAVGDTIVGHKQ